MTDITKTTITKLNGQNYFVWKYRMEMLLMKEKLWSVVSEDRPVAGAEGRNEEQIAAWQQRDDQARGWIGLLVDDSQLCHIRNSTTAKEAWHALKAYHEKDTLSNKVTLIRRICCSKMEESGNMDNHLTNLTNLFQKLTDLGEELSDSWIVGMILSSLPRSYDTLVTALETRPETDLTLSLVQSKLLAEHNRRKEAHGSDGGEAVLRTTDRSTTCFFCKKSGHMKRDCMRYRTWKEKQNKETKTKEKQDKENKAPKPEKLNKVKQNQEFLFMVTAAGHADWVIDSGATCHIASDERYFVSLDKTVRNNLNVANGEKVSVKGKGTCMIRFVNADGVESRATVSEVMYAPDIDGNLLSVKKLLDNGYTVNFVPGACEISYKDRKIGIADEHSNLFRLRKPIRACVVSEHKSKCIHFWHRVFGHRDPEAVKLMCLKGLTTDMTIEDCNINTFCEVCAQGKLTRMKFPKQSLSKSTAPLDLIHTDVCGPMQTTSPSGMRYVLTLIDDFSRYTVIYLIKQKSEVEIKLKEYIDMVKTTFGRKPKVIRSDRGGEYVGKRIIGMLKSEGIRTQYTAPYTPQQNGVAERKNRTLIEMARCMLLEAGLPYSFWAEAVNTANYIQNRSPSRAVDKTPHELWTGYKPGTKHLAIFGIKCFVHIPSQKRRKLDNVAVPMIFIGYDEHSKAYRCYDPLQRKMVISRDVRFTSKMYSASKVDINLSEGQTISVDESASIQIDLSEKDENPVIVQEEWNDIRERYSNSEYESADEQVEQSSDEEGEAEQQQQVRVSQRVNKGVPPRRFIEEINAVSIQVAEPKTLAEVMSSKQKTEWIMAMDSEMDSLMKNETWELCELPSNRKAVGCKWIFKLKTNANGSIKCYKARLVAQGFSQKYGTDYDQVFAPVVKQTTFRILLAIAAKEGMLVFHWDAKTAFLNGRLKEKIYMKQPPGYQREGELDLVCLLKKSIYGLKQAARSWNEAIHDALEKVGFIQGNADPCMYSAKLSHEWCFILIYVDDLVIASKELQVIESVKEALFSEFEMQDLGEIRYYLGMEIEKNLDGYYQICQTNYIHQVASLFGLNKAKASNVPIDPNYDKSKDETEVLLNNANYQRLIGCLLYISVCTRPDISASVSILAQKVSKATQRDWSELKRVVKYLVGSSKLKLTLGKAANKEFVFGYADANWAESKEDRKSNSGYVFLVNGGVVSWACRKQTCVALSTTEAEFVALSSACQEALWLHRILDDMKNPNGGAIAIYEDNQSCLKLIEEEKLSNRTKHIDTRYHFVKDLVSKGDVQCKYCPTEDMLADLLTKPLPVHRFKKLREECSLV